jgi:hypothetical protein
MKQNVMLLLMVLNTIQKQESLLMTFFPERIWKDVIYPSMSVPADSMATESTLHLPT